MKKTVLLTGATGNMGWAGFQELYKKKDRFNITVLARPSKKNKQLLGQYEFDPAVKLIWGDLTDYSDVLAAVTGADYVLHVGGMVSPAADYYPEKTLKVNISSSENIVKAVLAQPNADEIKVVYIGSVAEYGNRMFSLLWGRTGDPMRASAYDMYSVSKCKAEKLFVDSGLKNWVVLRQTGILYPGILKVVNPTAFHVPVQGVLEWATIEDSGRVLGNIVEDDVPAEFWNRFYNISSGQEYRMTNYEFETRLLKGLGLPGPEKVFEPQWFALKNFHGMWYTDADKLDDYLRFREYMPVDKYFAQMKSKLPWFYHLAFLAPAFAVKLFMKPFAFEKGMGTQWWVENDQDKFKAYYGSKEAYSSIRSWDDVRPSYFEKNQTKAEAEGSGCVLDHGYDETKSIYDLTLAEVEAAAEFRGGRFLGPKELLGTKGAIFGWECEHGHQFHASLEFVLLGGGWCTECALSDFEHHITPKNKFASLVKK
jgi:nucleoside-diphosphate-sugar epimerase